MNYKKIIKNQETRLKILSIFNFVPDKLMLKFQYFIKFKKKLNLNNPKLFSEKMQWLKLNYKNRKMIICADKVEVRKYLAEKNLDYILNEVYGVYENTEQIDFLNLPIPCVIKSNNGAGSRNIMFIKEPVEKDNIEQLKTEISSWLLSKYSNVSREWMYECIEPKIIIEKYIESNNKVGLTDYKFYCFHGEVEYILVINERSSGFVRKSIYDSNFNSTIYKYADADPIEEIEKPIKFEEMKEIARTLSKDFPFARIDLYNENNKVLFGEITFFPGSGYLRFFPEEFDNILGEKLRLEDVINNEG